MSICEEVSVQAIDGTDPTMLIVPIDVYRDLILWTDHDESELQLPPQFIRSTRGRESHVVLLEDDFLTLKNTWQVADDQRFFLDKGQEKGAWARALYCPDSREMLVLKGSGMADAEARKDFAGYSAIRRRLRGENGPVKWIDREWVFVRNEMFDSPSTAASVLAGYRIGAFDGWRRARAR